MVLSWLGDTRWCRSWQGLVGKLAAGRSCFLRTDLKSLNSLYLSDLSYALELRRKPCKNSCKCRSNRHQPWVDFLTEGSIFLILGTNLWCALDSHAVQVFKKICESNLVDAVSEWLNEGRIRSQWPSGTAVQWIYHNLPTFCFWRDLG